MGHSVVTNSCSHSLNISCSHSSTIALDAQQSMGHDSIHIFVILVEFMLVVGATIQSTYLDSPGVPPALLSPLRPSSSASSSIVTLLLIVVTCQDT